MKVTIVPIVIGALGTVTKGLLKVLEDLEVGGRVETIQTTAFWGRPEYWDESWRLEDNCCHSNSSEKPSANTDVKNSIIIIIIIENKRNLIREDLDMAKKEKLEHF